MSDLESSTPPTSGLARRRLTLAGIGLLAGAMIVAFIMGGKSQAPRRSSEPRREDDTIVKSDKPQTPDILDPWGEFAPEGSVPPLKVPSAPGLPGGQPGSPPIVTPGPSGTIALADPKAAPGLPTTTPNSSPATTTPQQNTVPVAPPAASSVAQTTPPPAVPPAEIPKGQPARPSPSAPPAVAAIAAAPATPPVKPVPSETPAASPARPPEIAASSTAPSPAKPSATAVTSRPVIAQQAPGLSAHADKTPASPAAPRPAFKKPRSVRTGVVSQSTDLVKQNEFSPAAPPAAEPATSSTPAATPAPPRAAVVTLPEAKSYSATLTQSLRAERRLTPTQTVRLPSTAETANPKIWHHDDQPAAATETRPFGLVIEETDPAARAVLVQSQPEPPPAAETPEGIPLRTDIPAGTSPLDKNGPDNPLWKRPQ